MFALKVDIIGFELNYSLKIEMKQVKNRFPKILSACCMEDKWGIGPPKKGFKLIFNLLKNFLKKVYFAINPYFVYVNTPIF